VDPESPRDAQSIVAAYLKVVEAHAATEVYPGSLRELPYSKELIRAAFKTSTTALAAADKLTPELRDYLEVAYVSLADYVEEESVTLLREYKRAGEELAADRRLAREKAATDAWRRVTEQSRLAGQVAKAINDESDRLRTEFRSWQESVYPSIPNF
jgi:gas vesicle protein